MTPKSYSSSEYRQLSLFVLVLPLEEEEIKLLQDSSDILT